MLEAKGQIYIVCLHICVKVQQYKGLKKQWAKGTFYLFIFSTVCAVFIIIVFIIPLPVNMTNWFVLNIY